MTQRIILDKFIKYLILDKEVYLAKLEHEIKLFPERLTIINKHKTDYLERHAQLLKQLANGHCFGFSLIYATIGIAPAKPDRLASVCCS